MSITKYCFSKLLSITILLSCLLLTATAQANTVTAVRIWPADIYTRITIEAEKPILYKMTTLKDPERVVVDIEDIDLNVVIKALSEKVSENDPYISKIRVANFKPKVVRLVVDLKSEVKPAIFTLPPAGDYKHRLVLDIYPTKDPLMAMLDERDNPEQVADLSATSKGSQVVTLPPSTDAPVTIASDSNSANVLKIDENANVIGNTGNVSEAAQPASQTSATAAPQSEVAKEKLQNKPLTKGLRQITIAIDPGHGGEDPGAIGATGSREKEITLLIAKKLKAKIDEEPNMRAVLTRDGDYFIPLHMRVLKARKLQADLFISIHADAFTNPAAHGSSVFALSEKGATSASARYLANKENQSDLIGGVSLNVKDPLLARTLLDLSQTATINDSLKLGKVVLGNIGEINKLHKNHVEQAGFAVLKSPDIPSILVETAFISNPEEERKLNDGVYQDKLVMSILTGIKKYFSTNPALARTKVAFD
ncbi:MAG: N-acetylmuramoyl-L-alanine amidase [Methylotenera sp.]|nr:N-acetylmuramoyl-L-alanine amidase [Methylotenera sp.]